MFGVNVSVNITQNLNRNPLHKITLLKIVLNSFRRPTEKNREPLANKYRVPAATSVNTTYRAILARGPGISSQSRQS